MVSDFFLSETALSIWAKTNFWHSAPPEDVGKQWLPLAVHMADSGEVAELIWDNYLSPRQRKLLVEPLPRVETIEQSSRNEDRVNWLASRAEGWGFEIPQVSVNPSEGEANDLAVAIVEKERIRFQRGKSGKPGSLVTLNRVAFEGILTVKNPAVLRSAMQNGLGAAKAYGCGLLTLAPR